MIGCVLGTLGIIGLARWMHARRHGCWAGGYGGGGCGGGGWGRHHRHGFGRFHHRGWDGPGGYGGEHEVDEDDVGPGGGFGGRGRTFLRAALDPLEMTPAQERAVFAALDELREAGGKLRGELRASRKDIAAAFRRPTYDGVAMGELYARHDTAIEALRKAFVGTSAKVHDALEERQRARLADLIESGPNIFGGGFGRGGGGFGRRRWSW
jgi:hypothetical protein